MTALEIVKAAYPGIPDAILNEYAELLPAEASALSAEFAATDTKFFQAWKNLRTSHVVNFMYSSGGAIPNKLTVTQNFLNPQNANETQSVEYSFHFNEIHWVIYNVNARAYEYEGDPFDNYAKLYVNFDRRIFGNPAAVKTKQTSAPGSFYSNTWRGPQYYARIIILALLSIEKKPYSGLTTIVALYENGVTLPDVNYEKAYSFLTYVNAYKKFSTEIDSERAYLQREAEAQLASYRQDYTDRAQREKADLQSKKIQMLMAIDNDTKDATRDFQNMLLNAQNLKQNLRGSIG